MVFKKINLGNFSRKKLSQLQEVKRRVFSKFETSVRKKLTKVQNQAEDGSMFLQLI